MRPVKRHFAKKRACRAGHTHDSIAEATRCDLLHDKQAKGEIVGLKIAPRFHFNINGRDVKMRNGQVARYTADFTYIKGNRQICEDVKAKNGFVERDVPLRLAIFGALFPDIILRIVK